jgi:spoIIIJ-associated protein
MTVEGTFRGATLDEAISSACAELRARVGELHYEVISEEIGVCVEINAELDLMAVLGLFLSETFRAGEIEVKAQISLGEEAVEGELSGGDLQIFTNSGGRGLDALQYLCNRMLSRRIAKHPPVHLDTDGFKARRAEQLREKAESAADQAVRRRSPVVLGPLTPAARREIHLALADDPGVETESEGEGFLKRVVVRPRRRR